MLAGTNLCSLPPSRGRLRHCLRQCITHGHPHEISSSCQPKAGSKGSPNAPEVISFAPSLGAGKGLRLLPKFLSPDRLQARERDLID